MREPSRASPICARSERSRFDPGQKALHHFELVFCQEQEVGGRDAASRRERADVAVIILLRPMFAHQQDRRADDLRVHENAVGSAAPIRIAAGNGLNVRALF